jgi:septation ring formation regulator EzrA
MSSRKIDKKDTPVSERRFGVILEDIGDKFQQVLGSHAALDKKFDKQITEFRQDFSEFQKDSDFKYKVLSDDLKDIKHGIKDVQEYLLRIDDEIQDLKKVLYKKADLERLFDLEKRVAQAELVIKKWRESR